MDRIDTLADVAEVLDVELVEALDPERDEPRAGARVVACSDDEIEALVHRFAHRVRYFAKRIERRYGLDPVWRDDLISAGYFGLLKALRNRRDSAHPHELSAYVSKRVEGAVLDEARQVLGRAAARADLDPADLEECCLVDEGFVDWLGRGVSHPEDLVDGRDRWRQIADAFDHLDEDHKGWLLAVAAGSSLAEIARGDGASPARLQNQMARITRSVRANKPELRRLLRHEI